MKKYRVIEDLQGGSFGMDRDYTIEQWREQALEWAEMDENDGLIEKLESLSESDVLPFIAEFWQLEFAEVIPDEKSRFICECCAKDVELNKNGKFYGDNVYCYKCAEQEKTIEFVAGYHEWQVIVDEAHIHSFDDFSEDIKEDMTAEQVDDLVDDLIYGWQLSFENDCDSLDEGEECPITPIWETHGEQLHKAMAQAICLYYGIEQH